ncbi:flagellar type III secretion system pore protein FliP [Aliiroseovarius sediminis]|uniref:flagellar type III secretion system pore protein FliP n=2 Tax=Aliiroseovarius TaxID=1658781 RepID=UPI003B849E23
MKPISLAVAFALVVMIVIATAGVASAQDITLSLGDEQGGLATRTIQVFVLLTVLSLAPGLAIMITCFPFIVTVLSILRQAIGLQQSPPNMLIISLALFLTYFIMEPVFVEAWMQGGKPFSTGTLDLEPAFMAAIDPFRVFMAARVDPETFSHLAALREQTTDTIISNEAPLSLLVPSFLLSEVERAFQIGFLVFLPFLVIDLVVAAILMSMGMMMVPPAIVSLPFKLAFFVVADGWTLISGALVRSYF